MIVRTNRELKASYNELTAGDIFIGNLSLKYLKQPMLIDMLERGIRCLPSPLAQILNLSLIHISEPTRLRLKSRMPSSA